MEIKKYFYKGSAVLFAILFVGISNGNLFAENAELTTAPQVPAPITRNAPAAVVVNFEAREITRQIDGDKQYQFWTFNGTTPGPMIRVRVGDSVQFHLANHKDNQWPHNIDIHAVNGPGGGAHVNEVKPGEASVFTFKTSTSTIVPPARRAFRITSQMECFEHLCGRMATRIE